MYLGEKEVKRLKKQKRLEEILEHESSDLVKNTKEYLDEFEYDIPLTRREKKLIAKQHEYELLLEQIGEEKKNSTVKRSYKESNANDAYIESKEFEHDNQEDIESEKTDVEQVDELLYESEKDNVKLTRKEKRALKKEQRLMKKLNELGIDEDDLKDIGDYNPSTEVVADEKSTPETIALKNAEDDIESDTLDEVLDDSLQLEVSDDYVEQQEIDEDSDELEQLKATWANRKIRKKQEKHQKMQAKLDALEQSQKLDEDDFEQEDDQEVVHRGGFFGWKTRRANKKQELDQSTEEFFDDAQKFDSDDEIKDSLEQDEQSQEDEKRVVVTNDDNTSINKSMKKKRVSKEIADALGGEDDESAHHANKEYLLEKVRLEIEKEKLALEKYRIKNEAKLKRQIERDKMREMMRLRKEKNNLASNNNIEEDYSENENTDFADAIGGVIREISKEKPEVKDLVTSTGIVTTPKTDLNNKKKKRHKRGVLVVKRSGSSYGE